MKVLIHVDMEGATGCWRWHQISGEALAAQRARESVNREVNATVEGVLEAGADEVTVWDTHGPQCIQPELLHPAAQVVLGKFGMGRQFAKVFDQGYDAMLFVAQHPMAGSGGNLAHTWYAPDWSDGMMLNGSPAGELSLRAHLAGRFGVPSILVTGDDRVCAEAKELCPTMVTAQVKRSLAAEGAQCLSQPAALSLIKAKSIEAIESLSDIPPVWQEGPFELRVHFLDPKRAEHAAHALANGKGRIDSDGLAVIFSADDYLDIAI